MHACLCNVLGMPILADAWGLLLKATLPHSLYEIVRDLMLGAGSIAQAALARINERHREVMERLRGCSGAEQVWGVGGRACCLAACEKERAVGRCFRLADAAMMQSTVL
jgi:hypothetical protein